MRNESDPSCINLIITVIFKSPIPSLNSQPLTGPVSLEHEVHSRAPSPPNPTVLMRNESDHSCIEMQIFKDDGVSNYSIFLPMEFVNEQRLGPHFSGHFTRVRAGLLMK